MPEPIANTILRAAGEESIARLEAMLPNVKVEREVRLYEREAQSFAGFSDEMMQECEDMLARKEG